MEKKSLSILIPSRNEMFLRQTVEDILKNIEGDTEILVGLDGQKAYEPLPDDMRVKIIYVSKSIGQRAMTNKLCKLSTAKYVMKVDAHCAFDKGFDVKMMDEMHDDWTMVPIMRNLHVFDWVCQSCGNRMYQAPTPTMCYDEVKEVVNGEKKTVKKKRPGCDNITDFKRDIVWNPKPSPASKSYLFDPEPHFQYFGDYTKRPEFQGKEITETMSLQGSCFMLTREKYWELNICDEQFGNWGSQGIEVAVKTWLSGGKVMCNQKTWYAHLFRTQGGDFGMPYPLSQSQVKHAKSFARELFFENRWPQQVRPLSWLLERFWPVTGWTEEQLAELKKFDGNVGKTPTKGIIFYTDNRLNLKIAHKVQKQLKSIGLPIISSSLKPMSFGDKNVHIEAERGPLTMFRQILLALEALDTDIVYFCEHDVLYHPSHFTLTPLSTEKFYYNQNFWKVWKDGFAAHWDANQVSGLFGYREYMIKYFKSRIEQIERKGFNGSYEPGGRDEKKYEVVNSELPNVDIRHDNNQTRSHRKPEDFRDKSTCVNWQESTIDKIPGWEGFNFF